MKHLNTYHYVARKSKPTKFELITYIINSITQQQIENLYKFNWEQLTYNTLGSIRRALINKNIPKFITNKNIIEIDNIYKKSKVFNNNPYGIKFHVDHVIPLKCKEAFGFHHPNNLQLVTDKYNLRKGNKLLKTIFYS